jgi:hypothetical protein
MTWQSFYGVRVADICPNSGLFENVTLSRGAFAN